MTQHTDHPASAGRPLPEDAMRVALRPGERLVDGEVFYSSRWLMDDVSSVEALDEEVRVP